MRRSLFVFRVLLPPLLFLRLCLSRPSESDKDQTTNSAYVQFGVINSEDGSIYLAGMRKELPFSIVDIFSNKAAAIQRQRGQDSVQNEVPISSETLKFDELLAGSGNRFKTHSKNLGETLFSSKKVENVKHSLDIHNSVASTAHYPQIWFLNKSFRHPNRSINRSNLSPLQQKRGRSFYIAKSHRVVKHDKDTTYFKESGLVLPPHDGHRKILTANNQSIDVSNKTGPVSSHRSRRSVNALASLRNITMRPPLTKPPDYMVHLFHLLSGTHYDMLRNTVVTSFSNINQEDTNLTTHVEESRTHTLAFNFFTSEGTETVQHSELRLYMVLDHNNSNSIDIEDMQNETLRKKMDTQWTVGIYMVVENSDESSDEVRIASKTLGIVDQVWESFNVTSEVQGWATSGVKIMKVKVSRIDDGTEESEIGQKNSSSDETEAETDLENEAETDLQLDIKTDDDHDPLLIVFSKKTGQEFVSSTREKREVKESTESNGELSEQGSLQSNNVKGDSYNHKNVSYFKSHYFQGLIDTVTSMKYHSLEQFKANSFKPIEKAFTRDLDTSSSLEKIDEVINTLTANIHNFTFQNIEPSLPLNISEERLRDWIFSDQQNQRRSDRNSLENSQNQDMEEIFSNFSPESKLSGQNLSLPTKKLSKQQVSQKTDVGTKMADGDNSEMNEYFLRSRVRRNTKSRYRRHLDSLFRGQMRMAGSLAKRSKRTRNSCRRAEMYVSFETFKWHEVIIFPRGYQAFQCIGKCYTPISAYLTPSKHAIIQTLVHTSYPKKASRACCVPTKLDPISILYLDEHGNIKYDYTYEGMVVAECGCR